MMTNNTIPGGAPSATFLLSHSVADRVCYDAWVVKASRLPVFPYNSAALFRCLLQKKLNMLAEYSPLPRTPCQAHDLLSRCLQRSDEEAWLRQVRFTLEMGPGHPDLNSFCYNRSKKNVIINLTLDEDW